MDREIVIKVARAAHIALTEEELDKYCKELADIFDYFKILDECPVSDKSGLTPIEVLNVYREDIPHMDYKPSELLKDMDIYDNYVRGPRLS